MKQTNRVSKLLLLPALAIVLTGCGATAPAEKKETPIDKEVLGVKEDNKTNETTMTQESQLFAGNADIAGKADSELAKIYRGAILHTNQGDITVEFYGADSPKTVANFIKLSLVKFYDTTKFHRVIKDFMIQGGDPNSKDDDWTNDGMGGPDYKFEDEFNTKPLVLGSLAMANAGPNTNGSQFFIVTAEKTPWLDGKHTNFGQVTAGMDIVKKIEKLPANQNDHPTTDAIITSIELLK